MAAERQMGRRAVSEADLPRADFRGKSATLITRSIFVVEASRTYRWIEENIRNRSISKALYKVVILHHHFPWQADRSQDCDQPGGEASTRQSNFRRSTTKPRGDLTAPDSQISVLAVRPL